MKLIKLINPRQLLPLSSLITPVVGEMTINASGLPTPWPIGLINLAVLTSSIFLFSSKKTSFSRLSQLTLAYSIINSLVSLISSWFFLAIKGIEGFYYPALALPDSFFLLITMIAIERGFDKLKAENEEGIELEEFNLQEDSAVVNNQIEEKISNYQALKRAYSLRYLCWVIYVVSFIWEFVASSIYSSGSNFITSSPFITSCSQTPNRTLYENLTINCQEKNEDINCFIANESPNRWMRFVSLFVHFFIMCGCSITILNDKERDREGEEVRSRMSGNIKWRVIVFYIVVFIFSLIYLITDAKIQAEGTSIPLELEKVCDINHNILSSKIGYIVEWWANKINTARHITLS